MATKPQIKEALLNTCVIAFRGSEEFPKLTLTTCRQAPGFDAKASAFLSSECFHTFDLDVEEARYELRQALRAGK
jgi:hypothetical protein